MRQPLHDSREQPALSNALGEVYVCDCHGIQLVLGPVALHLNGQEMQLLTELLEKARQHGQPTVAACEAPTDRKKRRKNKLRPPHLFH